MRPLLGRGRAASGIGAVVAVGVVTAGIAAAATAASVVDPAADVVNELNGPSGDRTADLLGASFDFGDFNVRSILDFAAPTNLENGVLVDFASPAAGGSALAIAGGDGSGGGIVLVAGPLGFAVCDEAAVTGLGTTEVTIDIPGSCINPPPQVLPQVLSFGDGFGLDVLDERTVVDTFGAGSGSATRLVDADPSALNRLDQDSAFFASFEISQALFEWADTAILVSGSQFPDALTGSALFSFLYGPMLFTAPDGLPPGTGAELQRILEPGAEVIVLGGPAAIGDAVLDDLRSLGFAPRRIYGKNRIETSIAVGDEVQADWMIDEVLFARGWGPGSDLEGSAAWADSIAAAPYVASHGAATITLVGDHLLDAHREFLARARPSRITLLGGTAAVPQAVEDELVALGYDVRRIAGRNRADTAAIFAEEVWSEASIFMPGRPPSGPRGIAVINAFLDDTWAFALPAALVASIERMPYIVVDRDHVPAASRDAVRSCGTEPEVTTWVIGSEGRISGTAVAELTSLDPDGGSCT